MSNEMSQRLLPPLHYAPVRYASTFPLQTHYETQTFSHVPQELIDTAEVQKLTGFTNFVFNVLSRLRSNKEQTIFKICINLMQSSVQTCIINKHMYP